MAAARALVTGIGGQDGSYLAELLLSRGVEVIGVERPDRVGASPHLIALQDRIQMIQVDLASPEAVVEAVALHAPTEIYHLAADSFVPTSWLHPTPTLTFSTCSTTAFLDAIVNGDRSIRFFFAASAEVFGRPADSPQDERTPITPVTPYGAGKAVGLFLTRMYRERFSLHASCGILFNHESPRRPPNFVTRKVTRTAAAISLGLEQRLVLGDLHARRDWSYAGDIVAGIAAMVAAETADDYVLASGRTHSVRQLVERAFERVGLDWESHVVVDEALLRPTEAKEICGDPTHAEAKLGWTRDVSFEALVDMMVDADLTELRENPAVYGVSSR